MDEKVIDIADVARRLAPLKRKYIEMEHRDTKVRRTFDRRLADLREDIGRVPRLEARGMMLFGDSGAGKSRLLEWLFSTHPDLPGYRQPGSGCPLVSIRTPSPATLTSLGLDLLHAMGYPLSREKKRWEVWDLVRKQIIGQKIMAIHIDEAQDVLTTDANEIKHIINTFKTLTQDAQWPIVLILSGMPDLLRIGNMDFQLKRRLPPIELAPISAAADGEDFSEILGRYAKEAGLKTAFLEGDAVVPRLIHAATNQFGLTLEIIVLAIEQVFMAGSQVLTIQQFANAYEDWTGCVRSQNPFVVDDWTAIDTKKLLPRPKDPAADGTCDEPASPKKTTPRRNTRW